MAEPKPTFAEMLAQYEASRPEALDERFTQPVPPEAGPFQQIIPEEETYRDMAERNLAGVLGDDRQAFRRAGKLLDTADQLPILGDASAGIDVVQAIKDVDPVGMGIGALGMIPGVNRAAIREALDEKIKNARNFFGGQTPDQPEIDVRQLNTVSKPMSERLIRAQYMGFDTTKPYYHGTAGVKDKKGKESKGIEEFESKHGSFFSESPDVAATYAVGREGHSTYPVFLNKTEYLRFRPAKKDIESSSYGAKTSEGFVEKGEAGTPFYYYNRIPRAGMLVDLPDGTTRKLSDVFPKLKPSLLAGGRITNTDELARAAKKAGYKGIILEDVLDIGAGTTMPVNPKKLLEANEVVVAIDPTTIRSVNANFDPDAKDSAEILRAKGGMVTDMNRPVISRGLSNLIRNYSQGPLARLNVPRGTVPVQGMFNGGMPFNFDPFASGSELTEQQEEVQAQMAAEALADNAPLPPVPLNQAQQKAYKAGLLQMDDLGYPGAENKEYMYSGDVSASLPSLSSTTTTVPQEQGTSEPADTIPIEDSPASPPINTNNQFVASDPTVPFTMPAEVEETTTTTTTQPTTTTTQPTTQTTTTQPTTTTTQPVSLPYKDPNELAEARAAEAAAAAEAERVRLANLAAQEQLAAEQLAAEEAARVAAEEEQQRLLEAQQAAEAAAQAEEQQRIALDQQLAQELAAQEQAQLAAQQNIDSQVSAAEQLAAQQAADRASNEAAIAAEPMPTAVFQAPTPNTIDRSQFGVPPEEGTQAVDPNAPNFLVADMIDPYTSGYAPTLGMDIKETAYPYQGMTEQEMQDQNVYRAEVFQPMPKLSFGTGDAEETEGEQSASSDPEINWDIGSTKPGGPGSGPGRYVELPTGVRIWVPDYGNLSVNTDNAESEAGEYGLTDQQRYQCPGYYTLAFEGGQPYCKKVDKSQWPSGGQQRLRVSKLPSRTAVQVVETNQPGSETQEGYAQGGPVQNFNYGGFVNRPSLQQQIQQAQRQGPFGQALFQRFGQYQPPPQQQMPPQLSTGEMKLENLIPTPGGPLDTQQIGGNQDAQIGMQFTPPMDRMARVSTRGPESFGQMGPPQQIGQIAEPNTQQLASQLQNVTQQVNQLSSHLGVSGGGMTQGSSQYQPGGLQGGIGGLLQNLRPGLPPPQLRTTGPVRPAMLQFLR